MGIYADWIYPPLLEYLMSRPQMMKQRAATLQACRGEVLEIGFGTGLNLAYYPQSVTKLTVVDPARLLPKKVRRRLDEAPVPVEVLYTDAAHLPLDAGRFDQVLTTWTLCTIREADRALGEIRRVLKPGGQYIFLEHGRSEHSGVARWQDRLNPIQKVVGVGCNLNRPIDRLITQAEFEIAQLERFQMPHTPRIMGAHYRGHAVKA
jgi:ubiquinone/menaquinone biosynthesis C-methylase UbiE